MEPSLLANIFGVGFIDWLGWLLQPLIKANPLIMLVAA